MSDIVERLRNWRTVHLARLHLLMAEAADEMERLRLSEKADCPEPENAADEDKVFPAQNMTTLTDAERGAIEGAMWDYGQYADEMGLSVAEVLERQATLRGLLERTK
jgi:hypothetical protein